MEISDLILENVPFEYSLNEKKVLDKKKDVFDLRQTYGFMLPKDQIQSILRVNYKCASLNNDAKDIRVDVFEFKSSDFILKNIDRFYHIKLRLNSNEESLWKYDMLIKNEYVTVFRSLLNLDQVLSGFVQGYKEKFDMKEIGFVLK